ncbi:MAG: DUF881 domain-containing protein [Peptococcaceae bacterium]|nr:DUF881 domain-containing protein [Peptococcaceae bacterium]
MKGRFHIALTAVCILLGWLLALQIRSTGDFTAVVPDLRTSEMRVLLMDALRQKQELQQELDALRDELRAVETAATKGEGTLERLHRELENARLLAGITAVEGRGLTVTINDSKRSAQATEDPALFIVHDEDILKITNVLRASGAEAISINGQRLLATSEIHCAGPSVSINNVRIAAPFVITAIGDNVGLESALRMRGGVIEALGFFGLEIDVKRYDKVMVPGFTRPLRFEWLRPGQGR